jgi:hypothetical protein
MAADARALAPVPAPRDDAALGDADPAYPTVSLVDSLYPCQTRALLPPPLDGVATPAIWARLAEPLRRVLATCWQVLGLRPGGEPSIWVAVHYGRIALNAHGCERLAALLCGRAPDPALVVPASGLGRLGEAWEQWRARRRCPALRAQARGADGRRSDWLERLGARDPAELDTAVLARGPLDDARWTDVLFPPLLAALQEQLAGDPALDAALGLEQRWAAALGQRLVAARVLAAPSAVAYLSVEERLQAVHAADPRSRELAAARAERVERFAGLELPAQFWGRPRASAGEST